MLGCKNSGKSRWCKTVTTAQCPVSCCYWRLLTPGVTGGHRGQAQQLDQGKTPGMSENLKCRKWVQSKFVWIDGPGGGTAKSRIWSRTCRNFTFSSSSSMSPLPLKSYLTVRVTSQDTSVETNLFFERIRISNLIRNPENFRIRIRILFVVRKFSNPNPNIRDSGKKIRIRIRIWRNILIIQIIE